MSKVWEKLDIEIAATPMPELYQNKMVSVYHTPPANHVHLFTIFNCHARTLPNFQAYMQVRILCNDCATVSEVQFHVVAQKCLNCRSYNTRQM